MSLHNLQGCLLLLQGMQANAGNFHNGSRGPVHFKSFKVLKLVSQLQACFRMLLVTRDHHYRGSHQTLEKGPLQDIGLVCESALLAWYMQNFKSLHHIFAGCDRPQSVHRNQSVRSDDKAHRSVLRRTRTEAQRPHRLLRRRLRPVSYPRFNVPVYFYARSVPIVLFLV